MAASLSVGRLADYSRSAPTCSRYHATVRLEALAQPICAVQPASASLRDVEQLLRRAVGLATCPSAVSPVEADGVRDDLGDLLDRGVRPVPTLTCSGPS